MKTFEVEVPAPVVWLNSNDRRHRQADAKLIKAWRETTRDLVPAGVEPFTERVRVLAFVTKPKRGRYDPGNLYPTAKACVDGLVDAGVLVDDDWVHVDGPDMRHGGLGPAGLRLVVEPLICPENLPIVEDNDPVG